MTDRPNWNVLTDMMADLKRATAGLPDLQKRMLTVTGTAWSDDGLIKAVVGPRGHLLELDIDPRVLRQPNSKALSTTIVQTVRDAIEDAGEQSRAMLAETLPTDLRPDRVGGPDLVGILGKHDADVRVEKDEDDG